jgi:hypothetical protein
MAPPIAILDNRKHIYEELRRLALTGWFLDGFFAHAKHCGVDVYTGTSTVVLINLILSLFGSYLSCRRLAGPGDWATKQGVWVVQN